MLLDIRYTGMRGTEPDLAALTRVLNERQGEGRVMQGGIERIQGRPQGRVLISAPLDRSMGLAAVRGQAAAIPFFARIAEVNRYTETSQSCNLGREGGT